MHLWLTLICLQKNHRLNNIHFKLQVLQPSFVNLNGRYKKIRLVKNDGENENYVFHQLNLNLNRKVATLKYYSIVLKRSNNYFKVSKITASLPWDYKIALNYWRWRIQSWFAHHQVSYQGYWQWFHKRSVGILQNKKFNDDKILEVIH